MKKITCAILLGLILCPRQTLAEGGFELKLDERWDKAVEDAPYVAEPKAPAKPNWTTRVLWGLGGAFTAFQAHELMGHYLFAKALGWDAEYKFNRVEWTKQYETPEAAAEDEPRDQKIITLSGYIVQGVTAEFMLSMYFVPKDSSFVIGYIAWSAISPVWHIFRYETSGNRKNNDVWIYEKNGGNVRAVEAILVAHSLWLATGLLAHRDFWTYISPHDDGAVAGFGKKF